jgi:arsenate reductase (glutaredoxin)
MRTASSTSVSGKFPKEADRPYLIGAGKKPFKSHKSYSVKIDLMTGVQIFGTKNSQATRAAERFFKERQVAIHFVDLKQKPMSPGEIKRFVDRFGLAQLVDSDGSAWIDAGLKYLKLSETELLGRIERDSRLLRLPLVRGGNRLSLGHDEESWKTML